MPKQRLIRCGKCHVVMELRHFVLRHRRPNDLPCPPVPCVGCRKAVSGGGRTPEGTAVCSTACESKYTGTKATQKAAGEVWSQLAAMERAKKLPPIYQRRRAS